MDAAAWEALGTWALLGGVVFAAMQLQFDRNNAAIERTIAMMNEWNSPTIQDGLSYVDKFPGDPDNSRKFLNEAYSRATNDAKQLEAFDGFLGTLARLTERMDIMVARKLVNVEMLTEHIGYEVLQAFYALQDILAEKAAQRGFDFLGFYDLVLRLKPEYINLPTDSLVHELTVACFKKPIPKNNRTRGPAIISCDV